MLCELHQMSNSGQLLLVNTKLHKFDLELLNGQVECRLERAIAIQELVLAQVVNVFIYLHFFKCFALLLFVIRSTQHYLLLHLALMSDIAADV